MNSDISLQSSMAISIKINKTKTFFNNKLAIKNNLIKIFNLEKKDSTQQEVINTKINNQINMIMRLREGSDYKKNGGNLQMIS